MSKRLRRRLTLRHAGRTFLERWGFVHDRIGGIYLHRISGPDPGLDVHDHPWSFVSIVLRGGYSEKLVEDVRQPIHHEIHAFHPAGSVHRLPLEHAHRIVHTRPGTWTIVFRGPTRRRWGFYVPEGVGHLWVDWEEYDYETRRPVDGGRYA